jgi:hypothetical protein
MQHDNSENKTTSKSPIVSFDSDSSRHIQRKITPKTTDTEKLSVKYVISESPTSSSNVRALSTITNNPEEDKNSTKKKALQRRLSPSNANPSRESDPSTLSSG